MRLKNIYKKNGVLQMKYIKKPLKTYLILEFTINNFLSKISSTISTKMTKIRIKIFLQNLQPARKSANKIVVALARLL